MSYIDTLVESESVLVALTSTQFLSIRGIVLSKCHIYIHSLVERHIFPSGISLKCRKLLWRVWANFLVLRQSQALDICRVNWNSQTIWLNYNSQMIEESRCNDYSKSGQLQLTILSGKTWISIQPFLWKLLPEHFRIGYLSVLVCFSLDALCI